MFDYESVLSRLLEWANGEPHVQAVALTGSATRGKEHALSDRDIEVFTTDPTKLLTDETWWRELGEVIAVEKLTNDVGEATRLVYYAGGKLDFTISHTNAAEDRQYGAPFTVLLDKNDLLSSAFIAPPKRDYPSAEEFSESINWAWAAAAFEDLANAEVMGAAWQ